MVRREVERSHRGTQFTSTSGQSYADTSPRPTVFLTTMSPGSQRNWRLAVASDGDRRLRQRGNAQPSTGKTPPKNSVEFFAKAFGPGQLYESLTADTPSGRTQCRLLQKDTANLLCLWD